MHSFASFDGIPIAYRDHGEGPAVVLLHGLSADGRMFGPIEDLAAVFEAVASSIGELGVAATPELASPGRRGLAARLLEAGFRVVVPDLRGHGASGKPHEPAAYARSALARDVIALTAQLGLERVAVLGYSLGAVAATKWLALNPREASCAVLAGIGKEVLAGEALDIPAAHPAATLPKPVTMRTYSEYVAEMLSTTDPHAAGASYAIMPRAMGNDVAALAACLRGDGAEQASPADLGHVTCPVLLLNGRDDPADRATAPLLDAFWDARAITCAGDHLTTLWQSSFHEAVVEFLRANAG